MRSNCGRDFTTLAEWPRQILESSPHSRLSRWTGKKGTPHQHFLLSLALVFLCVFLPSAVQAAILVVNVLTDEVEDSCPDTCSIRAALASANAGDEIQFDVTGTIVLTQGELVVDRDLTITGPGVEGLALDGNSASRVLVVTSGVTASIQGATLQNGYFEWSVEDQEGGGGIYNVGTLTLTDCIVIGNRTSDSGGNGAGIYNNGTLTLTRSTLSGNYLHGDYRQGAGLFNDFDGTATLIKSTVSGNQSWSGRGSGISNAGILTLTNSLVSGNWDWGWSGGGTYGAGIYNVGTVEITNSTLENNNLGISNQDTGRVTLTNSTLVSNDGGSIYNDSWGGSDAAVTLINCTLSEGGIVNSVGTITLARSIIANSYDENCKGDIVSLGDNLSSDATCITTDPVLNDRNNTDPLLHSAGLQDNGGPTRTIALQIDSPALDGVLYNDCPAPDIDQRGEPRPTGDRCDIGAVEMNMIPVTIGINPGSTTNYIDTSVDGEITVAILSTIGENSTEHFDALTIDPFSLRLGPYQATATNSPGLIEDVNNDGLPDLVLYFSTQDTGILCRDTSVLITGKTSDGSTIMGTQAIQTEGCTPAVITVNVLTDNPDDRCPTSCSIRAALARANPGDEIQFDVVGTIELAHGGLLVDKDLTITGPGRESLALDGNANSRVFLIDRGVTASIQGLTLQNGSGNGGGIYNKGTLALTDCAVRSNNGGNWGIEGGGIYNGIEGAMALINTTLSGNWAKSGAGGGVYNSGILTLTNSTLSENGTTDGYGGGLFNDSNGTVELNNSTIWGNENWYGWGGGIYNEGTLSLTNSTLSGNWVWDGPGGGIYNVGTINLARSIIANSGGGGNCVGEIISLGDNLSSDGDCITNNPTLNDRNNTDPLLDPAGLQDNGGPTRTIALQIDSPALDGVLYNDCPAPDIDQRGEPRPTGARCDIGAVEMNIIPVTIGINPGSTTNYVDTSVDGEITVAILSTTGGNSTEHFDALTIDPFSLRLGPYQATATNSPGLIQDVNNDGLPDLVLYFNTQDTGILCRDTSVLITGETFDGATIMGTQAIQTEGCNPVVIKVNVLTDETDDRCPNSCSIRAALARSNPGDEIQFDVTGTIVLTQGELVVDKDLTIKGPGAESLALDGNSASRVIVVNGGVTATITGLTIQNGYFGWEGGNEDRTSSGISNFGTLTLTDCNLSGNSGGGFGGGISNLDTGTLVMTNCTVGNNSSAWLGGGIYNEGALTLINSTITGNYSSNGGGIFNAIDDTLTLTNSTISGNLADNGYGGGIYNDTGGSVTISNSTLSDNSNSLDDGNSIFNAEGTVTLARSVIAHRSAKANCLGEITSQGDNLSSDTTCITNNRTLNDRNNTDPLLDPAGLQDNGGPTLTIALQPGSPALDGVRQGTCPPPDTDQRGVARPSGARCDIGAVESGTRFASFSPQAELEFGPREADDSFQGTAKFEVNSESNGIDPLFEDVRLTLGTLSIKVPAGSFTSSRRDDGTEKIWFRGSIEGVRLTVVLYPQGSNHYKVWVKGKGAMLDGVTIPPAISLTIGDDSGRSIMNSGRVKFRTSRGTGGQ